MFEVDPIDVANNENPTPLQGLGRFEHEAVAIDPATGIVYLTEDASAPNGLLYRATPTTPLGGYGSLRDGALLEALVALDGDSFVADLSEHSEIGTMLSTEWAAIPDPLAAEASTASSSTRSPGHASWRACGGVTTLPMWCARTPATTTAPSAEHDGQVWRLDPAAETMELIVQFGVNLDPASDTFDSPDNITVSPWGGLVLCADGEGVQHLFTVNTEGEARMFARNARDETEFTGATFAPTAQTLFVNIQEPGITFAVTGPWDASSAAPGTSTP